MPTYDDGESFTAGDDTAIHFDNDRLVELIAAINSIFFDPVERTMLRLAVVRAIYGRAEDI